MNDDLLKIVLAWVNRTPVLIFGPSKDVDAYIAFKFEHTIGDETFEHIASREQPRQTGTEEELWLDFLPIIGRIRPEFETLLEQLYDEWQSCRGSARRKLLVGTNEYGIAFVNPKQVPAEDEDQSLPGTGVRTL